MGKTIRPAPDGSGTYAELDGDNVFTGPIEVGGDYSKLILNNNLADNADDELGIRFIGEALQVKLGPATVPVQSVGINPDLATIYGSATNAVATVFGEVLSSPVVIADTSPEVYPYIPITDIGGNVWIAGVGYKHQGADQAWSTADYYLADVFTQGTVGSPQTPHTLSHNGYVSSSSVTDGEKNNIIMSHAGVANTVLIELAGKIDCNGSTAVNSTQEGHALSLLFGSTESYDTDVIAVGWRSQSSLLNYTIIIGGLFIDTEVPILNGPITYCVKITPVSSGTPGAAEHTFDYEVWINGALNVSGTKTGSFFDFFTLHDLEFREEVFTVAASFTGTAIAKSYGSLTRYTTI